MKTLVILITFSLVTEVAVLLKVVQFLIQLFLEPGGPVRQFPIPLGQEGGGEFVLHIDWSKFGMAGVLYQRQVASKSPVFIGAVGRKTTSYEANSTLVAKLLLLRFQD